MTYFLVFARVFMCFYVLKLNSDHIQNTWRIRNIVNKDNRCHSPMDLMDSPVGHGLLLLEYVPDLVAVEDEQQVRMPDEASHLGHLAVVDVQLVHHLVQVANFILSCGGQLGSDQDSF